MLSLSLSLFLSAGANVGAGGVMTVAAEPAGGHGAEAGAERVFPPFDPTYFPTQIFWLLLTFGLLYFALSRFFLPQVGGMLEERSNRIADDLDAAARMQREAEQAVKDYERELADARAKAHNVAETTRQSVEAEITAETEAADAVLAKQADIADQRIRKSRAAALSNIDDIATDVAGAAYTKLTGEVLPKAAIRRAVTGS